MIKKGKINKMKIIISKKVNQKINNKNNHLMMIMNNKNNPLILKLLINMRKKDYKKRKMRRSECRI